MFRHSGAITIICSYLVEIPGLSNTASVKNDSVIYSSVC